jgi:hypothetical protein
METFIYQFNQLPSFLVADESKLNTWKSGVIEDIKYEAGVVTRNYRFEMEGKNAILLITVPKEKESTVYRALHNLHGARRMNRQPIESC